MRDAQSSGSSGSSSGGWTTAAWVFGAVCVALFVYGTAIGDQTLRFWAKPWPVLILAAAVHRRTDNAYGRLIRNGLVASAVGDIFLELESGFLAGMVAFLIGHLFYLAAYLKRDRTPRWWLAIPFAIWGLVILTSLRIGLEAADMLIPVAVYCVAICAMLWRAWARCRPGVPLDLWIAAWGATLFAISDSMIAVARFGPGFVGSDYWIISLYWLGQAGIAYSALRDSGR